jgi:hypothetical protein
MPYEFAVVGGICADVKSFGKAFYTSPGGLVTLSILIALSVLRHCLLENSFNCVRTLTAYMRLVVDAQLLRHGTRRRFFCVP